MRCMPNRYRFKDLSEQEVLAPAISSEEEDDARIYRSYTQRPRADYPDTATAWRKRRTGIVGA